MSICSGWREGRYRPGSVDRRCLRWRCKPISSGGVWSCRSEAIAPPASRTAAPIANTARFIAPVTGRSAAETSLNWSSTLMRSWYDWSVKMASQIVNWAGGLSRFRATSLPVPHSANRQAGGSSQETQLLVKGDQFVGLVDEANGSGHCRGSWSCRRHPALGRVQCSCAMKHPPGRLMRASASARLQCVCIMERRASLTRRFVSAYGLIIR